MICVLANFKKSKVVMLKRWRRHISLFYCLKYTKYLLADYFDPWVSENKKIKILLIYLSRFTVPISSLMKPAEHSLYVDSLWISVETKRISFTSDCCQEGQSFVSSNYIFCTVSAYYSTWLSFLLGMGSTQPCQESSCRCSTQILVLYELKCCSW